ncbi:MAG: hypothetical protein K6E29_06595 [Cyanobacteria bacterium RUI128]|nr:hypothetical protein [Cyanobacteria bacterium RUI128]
MKISPISYNSGLALKGEKPNNQPYVSPNTPGSIGATEKLKYRPAVIGVLNGLTWTGIGFAFDKVCQKLFKSKTSNKTSLIINGAIGAVFGTYAYFKARQIERMQADSK